MYFAVGLLFTLILSQVSASGKRRLVFGDDPTFVRLPSEPSPYHILGLEEGEGPAVIKGTYYAALSKAPTRSVRKAYYQITNDLNGFFDGIVSEYAFFVKPKPIELSQDEARNFLFSALEAETAKSNEIISTMSSEEVFSHLQKAWETYLTVAVKRKNFHLVRIIITSGFDLNVTDAKGCSAIFYASKYNICGALLASNRVNLSIKDNFGNLVLHNATNKGKYDEAIFKMLLDEAIKNEINLNSQNRVGMTVLSSAIAMDNLTAAKLLLDCGLVNPEIPDTGDNDALHQCMFVEDAEDIIIRLLTEFRMDPSRKNAKGLTALHIAVKKCNPAYIDILLADSRISLNVQDNNGDTIFHYMYRKPIGPYSNDMFRLLFDATLRMDFNVNLANSDGYLAIHYAAKHGHASLVQRLLEMGSNVNAETNNLAKDTPFTMAYKYGHFSIVEMIAKKYPLPHLSSTTYSQERFLRKQALFAASIGPVVHPDNRVKVTVDRESVLQDAIKAFSNFPDNSFNLTPEFTFVGENGQDYGGLRREFCALLVQELFGPQSQYFETIGREYTIHIRRSEQNVDKDRDYLAIGRILGHLLKSQTLFEVKFAKAFLKGILDQQTNIDDLADWSEVAMESIKTLREESIRADSYLYFISMNGVPLIQDGENIEVTNENKDQYIELLIQYHNNNGIERQMKALKEGLFSVIPRSRFLIFNPVELGHLFTAMSTVDLDDWKENTLYENCQESDQIIQWFWTYVESLSNEKRLELVKYATSSDRLPLKGFSGLLGFLGIDLFKIFLENYEPKENHLPPLPRAQTCFNRLVIFLYASLEELKNRFDTALNQGTTGFGLT